MPDRFSTDQVTGDSNIYFVYGYEDDGQKLVRYIAEVRYVSNNSVYEDHPLTGKYEGNDELVDTFAEAFDLRVGKQGVEGSSRIYLYTRVAKGTAPTAPSGAVYNNFTRSFSTVPNGYQEAFYSSPDYGTYEYYVYFYQFNPKQLIDDGEDLEAYTVTDWENAQIIGGPQGERGDPYAVSLSSQNHIIVANSLGVIDADDGYDGTGFSLEVWEGDQRLTPVQSESATPGDGNFSVKSFTVTDGTIVLGSNESAADTQKIVYGDVSGLVGESATATLVIVVESIELTYKIRYKKISSTTQELQEKVDELADAPSRFQ